MLFQKFFIHYIRTFYKQKKRTINDIYDNDIWNIIYFTYDNQPIECEWKRLTKNKKQNKNKQVQTSKIFQIHQAKEMGKENPWVGNHHHDESRCHARLILICHHHHTCAKRKSFCFSKIQQQQQKNRRKI